MEKLPESAVLKFHPDSLNYVRKMYNLDKPGTMKEAVDILENWIKQQNHFVKKDINRVFLETAITTNKGSVERAKSQTDKLFTMRSLMPNFFVKVNAKTEFEDLNKILRIAVLPKLTDDYRRIYMIKPLIKIYEAIHILDFYRLCVIFGEYLRTHDINDGFIFIADYRTLNIVDFIAKLSITELQQGMTLYEQGYGVRIKSIHVITESKLIDGLIKIFKQVVSPKIGERINVHKNIDELSDHMPVDILPIEYGGKERSIDTLYDDWLDELSSEEHVAYMKEMQKAVTNENYRQKDKFNEHYIGMPGTFRTLSVD